MNLSELLWLFLCYSFLGWGMETAAAAIKNKKFTNKGLINGPFCIIYGVTICFISVFFRDLTGIWIFLSSAIISALIEWIAGHLIEKFFHERWWDYSDYKWNLDGYICIRMMLIWGVLCVFAVRVGNYWLLKLFTFFPDFLGRMIIIILMFILVVDTLATVFILCGRSKYLKEWKNIDAWLDSISLKLEKKIYSHVNRRIKKAYPKAVVCQVQENSSDVFAYGCNFYKIWWLFIIGAFLGAIVECVYCRIVGGTWMSRSSVVWGPFSIVWGLAIAAATLLLYKYRNRSDGFLFAVGTFLGGIYEYICSVFTEIVFGQVFWDYSWMPFNLGGRINLLYCFFWGVAVVVWIKMLYPQLSRWIEKVPMRTGKIISWCMIGFMSCNILVSCMALTRVNERNAGVEATYQWQEIMDEWFDDEKMHRIYPNAIWVP